MGTPEFAVEALKALLDSRHEVVGVVTQPDKPKGRHLHLEAPPVKQIALRGDLFVFQPHKLSEDLKADVTGLRPDVCVVAAYGKIIPKWLLELPRNGCINIHGSLLPKYRGAAPIQRAIMDGEKETGITIMQMDEGLDTGNILLQEKVTIGENETAGELEQKLAGLSAKLIIEVIDRLAAGPLRSMVQDGSLATYAAKIEKEEAGIDWSWSAAKTHNLIRALNPHPGAHTTYKGMRIKVWQAEKKRVTAGKESMPGAIVFADGKLGLTVAAGGGSLSLQQVQPEGKSKMSGAEFVRGYRAKTGERFE